MSTLVVTADPDIDTACQLVAFCSENSRETELDCMQRLAAGDSSAMREVIVSHGTMLAEFIGRLTAWHADHEDILQQVLVAVWENAGSYRGDGPLEGWLKRIAVYRSRNYFRTLSRIRRKLESLAVDQPTQSLDKSTEIREVNEELQNALTKLSPDDRTAVVLFYLEQQSGEQVADWMKISVPALHKRLSRARNKLKTLLSEERFHEK